MPHLRLRPPRPQRRRSLPRMRNIDPIHTRLMRNAKLTILAALSLAMLAVLVCGCFASAGLQFRDYTIKNPTVFHRQVDVGFQDARSIIGWVRYTLPLQGQPVALYHSSWSKFLTPSMPRMRSTRSGALKSASTTERDRDLLSYAPSGSPRCRSRSPRSSGCGVAAAARRAASRSRGGNKRCRETERQRGGE